MIAFRKAAPALLLAAILATSATIDVLEDRVAAAHEHYAKGRQAYALGQFAEAAREYDLAYRAKDDPALFIRTLEAIVDPTLQIPPITTFAGASWPLAR
jgi:hypothetical protein